MDTVTTDREALEAVLAVLEGKQTLTIDTIANLYPKATINGAKDRYLAHRLRNAIKHPAVTFDIYQPGGHTLDRVYGRVQARLLARRVSYHFSGAQETEAIAAWATSPARRPGDTWSIGQIVDGTEYSDCGLIVATEPRG